METIQTPSNFETNKPGEYQPSSVVKIVHFLFDQIRHTVPSEHFQNPGQK